MPASLPASVTPAVLEWARREAGYVDPEPVAKRAGVRPERLLAWERGERKPTLRQAQTLAKIYHRALAVFFLPEAPSLPPLAAQYRRLPGVQPGRESPELRLAIRVMSQRREVAIQLSAELGESPPEFRHVASLQETPVVVGARLRSALGVSEQEQRAWRTDWQAWRNWRAAVENLGVLVFQFPKVGLQEVRGLTLPLFPKPVIGVNSRELSAGARAFTLMHELVHLALARATEENVALHESRADSDWQQVERFAEEAASAVLIPQPMLEESLRQVSARRDAWDVQRVRQLAARFHVTPLAMATRLRAAGQLTWTGYHRWKQEWDLYVAHLPPRRGGFATPVEKTLGRAGRPFAQLVLEALDTNRITAVEACRYLDLRWDHVEKLRGELRAGPGEAREPLDSGD
jgi:Zn-dependent peptidase ImmA (M78 family)/DNA-binding XRE family transcriptional regulator